MQRRRPKVKTQSKKKGKKRYGTGEGGRETSTNSKKKQVVGNTEQKISMALLIFTESYTSVSFCQDQDQEPVLVAQWGRLHVVIRVIYVQVP